MAPSQEETIYMISDDETEESLALISMLEGIPTAELCRIIDEQRSAGCGFSRAARIFSISYIKAFLKQDALAAANTPMALMAMQRAIRAVSNDAGHADFAE